MKRTPLWPLLLALPLTALGVVAIHSASWRPESGTYAPFCRNQFLLWWPVALGAYAVTASVGYRWLLRRTSLVYALALVSLVGLFGFGTFANGARSWYRLGSVRLQPAEPAKLACLLASALAAVGARDTGPLRALWGPVAAIAPVFLLVAAQPDLGSAALLVPMALAIAVAGGARLWPLVSLGVLGAGAGVGAFFCGLLKPHQIERFRTFWSPELDPLGAGFQAIQAKIAIGAGGIWGQGFGHGTQARLGYLPDAHTDFIFCVLAEEGGLLVGLLVIVLLLVLVGACLWVAWRTKDRVGRLVAAGAGALFWAQGAVNIGMTLGLVPIAGVTLPFVSYGGSSLVTSYALLGLVANVSRQRPVFVVYALRGYAWLGAGTQRPPSARAGPRTERGTRAPKEAGRAEPSRAAMRERVVG